MGALAREGRTRFSFHAPVRRPTWFPHPGEASFFLHENRARRALSHALLADTLAAAAELGADYVVTHLTYGPSDTGNPRLAARAAGEACARIAALSRDFGVPVDIEFAAYTNAFHRPEEFLAVVRDHPELGLCVDVGHAFVGGEIRGRPYLDDIAALAPAARSLHLWNTRGLDHLRRHGHVPLSPDQDPGDGWADIARCLDIVLAHNLAMPIVFEYPVTEVTLEIQAGYDWAAALARRAGHRPVPSTKANPMEG